MTTEVLYVGDYKLQANQYLVGADAFQQFHRRVHDYEPLRDALTEASGVAVEYMDSPTAMTEFPRSVEALSAYDALVLSDLSRGTLEPHMHPDTVPGPNLLRIVREFVRAGGALVYCGGWMTYQGYQGVGNWAGTPVADVLPVAVRPVFDDRVERPEGATPEPTDRAADHPVTAAVGPLPDVYGYNRTGSVHDGATALATVDGDPLLAVDDVGDGRCVAYTSDPGPKWGYGMMEWDDYGRFWADAVRWATGGDAG